MRRLGTIGVLAGVGALLTASPALAAVITPTTFADEYGGGSGCSLREAIHAANLDSGVGGCPAGGGTDTIQLAAGTYALTIPPDGGNNDNGDGDLDPDSNMTITHSGLAPTAISGSGIDRVLHVQNLVSVAVSGVTIRDGKTSDEGGGILNEGTLDLSSATVTANESTGSFGGGISNADNGLLTVTNATVSGNRANSDSGGIDQESTNPTNLNHVTLSGNVADFDGDDSGNGGGIRNAGGVVNVRNTIIAGNTDGSPDPNERAPDCRDEITSLGNNLIGDLAGCGFAAAGGDKTNLNALLGPLADNGGSTSTHALLSGSPAIGGAASGAVATDQRGVPRSSDIGAYEFTTCGGKVVNRVGTSGADTLTGTAGADGILALDGKDKLTGLAGKDGLCGGNGKDKLKGGGGKDKLLGQGGKDTLIGGKGKDVCKGGAGKDKTKSC